ncbi:MAG: hypothetical protein RMK74_12410 [Myxococcales bacterium]|nr:hypothetical protein [Myxococcales bacterium]
MNGAVATSPHPALPRTALGAWNQGVGRALGTFYRRAEIALVPLDRARRAWLALLGPMGVRLVRDRELRVGVGALAAVLAAFAMACTAPLTMVVAGPLLLGLPHVIADVRYLVVRSGLHRSPTFVWLTVPPLALVGFGGGMVAGACAVAGAVIGARAAPGRRAAGLTAAALLAGCGALWSPWAEIVFAHVHNFLAVPIWVLWRRGRDARWTAFAVIAFLGAATVIASGLVDPWLASGGGVWTTPLDVDPVAMASSIAPGLTWQTATRLLALYAFAQSVHYAVWLRLVPDEDRERPTPRPFAASLRALRDDLGGSPTALALIGCAGIAAWAVLDLDGARTGYLRMTLFHGYLELAVLARWAVEGFARTDRGTIAPGPAHAG